MGGDLGPRGRGRGRSSSWNGREREFLDKSKGKEEVGYGLGGVAMRKKLQGCVCKRVGW